MTRRSLNKKQQLFVDEYLTDFNATQAAVRAGYSPVSARWIASRSLRNPAVKAAIARAHAPRLAALRLSAQQVLCELACVARGNMLDILRIDENGIPNIELTGLTRDQTAAIREIKVERSGAGGREGRRITIRMYDKLAALDRLARHYGLFKEAMNLAKEDELDAPAETPQHSNRQVARAICEIFRAAQEEVETDEEREEVNAMIAESRGERVPADVAAPRADAVEAIGAEEEEEGRWV